MPRMRAETLSFGLLVSPIEAALITVSNSIVTGSVDIQSALDDVFTQLRKTHLGHELHNWDAEVDEVE